MPIADPRQHRAGFVFPAPGDEPVRAFLLEQHAGEQQDGRDRGQPEHQPPVLAGREPVVDEVGHQDPAGDRELVEAHEAAAEPGRHDLADVEGNDHRGRADRQADTLIRSKDLDAEREVVRVPAPAGA